MQNAYHLCEKQIKIQLHISGSKTSLETKYNSCQRGECLLEEDFAFSHPFVHLTLYITWIID